MQSKQKTHIWLSLISVIIALLMCIPLAVTSFVYAEDYNGKKGPIPGDSDSKFPGNGCKLTGGEWGARVTMVDNNGNRVSSPIDYTNAKHISTISGGAIAMKDVRHFGKLCNKSVKKSEIANCICAKYTKYCEKSLLISLEKFF